MKMISLAVFLLSTQVYAQSESRQSLLRTFFADQAMFIHGAASFDGVEVALSGPDGFRDSLVFLNGETPVIDAVSSDGKTLADGIYHFHVLGFGEADGKLKGQFRIRNGVLRPLPKAATDPALHIDADRNIGIGTSSPNARVHIKDTTDPVELKVEGEEPKVMIERISTTTSDAPILLDLINNGQANLRMNNNEGGTNRRWTFGVDGNNRFFISATGTGAFEFLLQNNGNLTLTGTVTAPSDVNMKRDFMPISPEEVLAKLMEIPISTWSFRHDEAGVRHMGPMAQDFYAAYGLGADERHISFTDTAGVAFGAIQGINLIANRSLAANQALLDAQAEEIEALEARLAALEKRLANGEHKGGM